MNVVRCVDARRCELVHATGHRCEAKADLVLVERDLAYCVGCIGYVLDSVLRLPRSLVRP